MARAKKIEHSFGRDLKLNARAQGGHSYVYFRDRQCDKKVKHQSEEFAIAEARRLSLEQSLPFNTYYCIYCGFWHVGHQKVGSI